MILFCFLFLIITLFHGIYSLWSAFISCRLDYCNSLLYGINDGLLRRLQLVQNAAARLVTGAGRRDHITPVLRRSAPTASGEVARR